MKRCISFGVWLVLAGLFAAGPGRAQVGGSEVAGPNWQSFDSAIEKADAQDKYVLVDIYAPWCPWCRKMQKEVYSQNAIMSYMDQHFAASRLDATKTDRQYDYQGRTFSAQQLAARLGMQGTPTTVFLEPDGSYLAHVPGFIEADRFQLILRYIGSGAHQEQGFQEFLEAVDER